MISILSYYLMSPFKLIFLFSTIETIPAFVLAEALLKCGFMGLSIYLYLEGRHGCKSWLFVFVVGYALSGFVITYQMNSMWMDALIWLPLIASGIEEFRYCSRSYLKVAVGLMMGICSNYYTGFMLGIFTCLYYVLNTIFFGCREEKNGIKNLQVCDIVLNRKESTKSFFAYAIGNAVYFFILLGFTVGSMFWLLLPTLHSLKGNKLDYVSFSELLSLRPFFSPREILEWMLPAWMGNRPYVAILSPGLAVIFAAVLYFFTCKKGKDKKFSYNCEKIGNGLLIMLLLLSMAFAGPYQIWHGAAYPAGYPIRFGFIFIFALVKCGALAMETVEEVLGSEKKLMMKKVVFTVILLQCITAAANIYIEYGLYEKTTSYASYRETYSEIKTLTDTVSSEQGFYRLQWTGDANLGWMLNIPSLSSYTSCEDGGLRAFMGKLGLPVEEHASFFDLEEKGRPISSLMSVRYLILENDGEIPEYLKKVNSGDHFGLYEYREQLPLGIFTAQDLGDIENTEYDDGELVELIYSRISGKERELFVRDLSDDEIITDNEALISALEDILSRNMENVLTSDKSYLRWELNNVSGENRKFFIALPRESKSWRIRLDGRDVQSEPAAVYFMSVVIPPGSHTLSMKYYPRWLYEGIIISCFCSLALAAFLAPMIKDRKMKAYHPGQKTTD